MANDRDKVYKRIFLTAMVALIFGSFGFTLIASTWVEGKKLDTVVYEEHVKAQDQAFISANEKMDAGFERLNEGVDALLSREIEALQKAAAKK